MGLEQLHSNIWFYHWQKNVSPNKHCTEKQFLWVWVAALLIILRGLDAKPTVHSTERDFFGEVSTNGQEEPEGN